MTGSQQNQLQRTEDVCRTYYDNGNIKTEELPNGTFHSWYKNGQMREELLPDNTWRLWYENGNMKVEFLPNNIVHEWYEDGTLKSKDFSDGHNVWMFDENGNMTHHPKGMEFYRALKAVARKHVEKGNKKNKTLLKKGKKQKVFEVSMAILKQRFQRHR